MATVAKIFDKNKLKKALRRFRHQKLKEIDSEIMQKVPFKDFEKITKSEIKKMKNLCFKNRSEQLGYEMLANICNELLKQNKSQIIFLESIEITLKNDFLNRSITIREYREMVFPIREKIEYLKCKNTELEKTLSEALDGLALFKRLPSFVSAMHERKTAAAKTSLTLCGIFEKIKIDQLSNLEKEIMLKYGLTEQDMKKFTKKSKTPNLSIYELEKKIKRALSLADRNELILNRERERVAELLAELRRHKKGKINKKSRKISVILL
ncbi:MAG: hypothetical protein N3F05_00890 [Candidatus Diapherotrites archaeon]|nr:hypothetical protein [Candidatus Diapherotrites archaeon]